MFFYELCFTPLAESPNLDKSHFFLHLLKVAENKMQTSMYWFSTGLDQFRVCQTVLKDELTDDKH